MGGGAGAVQVPRRWTTRLPRVNVIAVIPLTENTPAAADIEVENPQQHIAGKEP